MWNYFDDRFKVKRLRICSVRPSYHAPKINLEMVHHHKKKAPWNFPQNGKKKKHHKPSPLSSSLPSLDHWPYLCLYKSCFIFHSHPSLSNSGCFSSRDINRLVCLLYKGFDPTLIILNYSSSDGNMLCFFPLDGRFTIKKTLIEYLATRAATCVVPMV